MGVGKGPDGSEKTDDLKIHQAHRISGKHEQAERQPTRASYLSILFGDGAHHAFDQPIES